MYISLTLITFYLKNYWKKQKWIKKTQKKFDQLLCVQALMKAGPNTQHKGFVVLICFTVQKSPKAKNQFWLGLKKRFNLSFTVQINILGVGFFYFSSCYLYLQRMQRTINSPSLYLKKLIVWGMAILPFLCRYLSFLPKLSYHRNVSLAIYSPILWLLELISLIPWWDPQSED